MIRDFSLVFLLLISDRRNLHRDSRRDTEQNVPCSAMPVLYEIFHHHSMQAQGSRGSLKSLKKS